MSEYMDGILQYSAEEVQEKLKEPGTVIIDVREPEEYEASHIPGVPLLPMQQIPDFAEAFSPETEYIFICRSGRRSHHVSMFLKDQGIGKAANFDGGMLDWDGPSVDGPEVQLKAPEELLDWHKRK
ncbi:rhodanese-like domain-containing protein [Alkalicoccus urumqiensis]|uniref:Rhodanese-like domain-containing protein n=1 Tax=Alkalicoccus urumqiensis TaxID=1548213 RepID=A0A2P6MF08_ALKUR|nr:rhodanese-like domain-containing protein [Alkalicoccus urumqiensis]PRO64854.1 rhodanese-like domain-containing protein [Alkalicoccus urumqiensis]